jgi:pimeloyl-ACP methyl ester carboxylesterase
MRHLLSIALLALSGCLATSHWPETARTPDGAAVRYEVHGRDEPTLVFVHGWSCHRQYWNELTRRFRLVRRVVALDLAGHGESDAKCAAWTPRDFAADVVTVCDDLALERVVLIGHGTGAGVALEAARLLGPRCRGVVAIDALHDVSRPATRDEVDALLAAFRADYPRAVEHFVRENLFSPRADARLVDLVAARMAQLPPAVALPALEAALLHDAGAALAAVDVPVHAIGTSRAVDVAAGRARNARFSANDMPDAGHFALLEDPERLARKIADFVRPLGD